MTKTKKKITTYTLDHLYQDSGHRNTMQLAKDSLNKAINNTPIGIRLLFKSSIRYNRKFDDYDWKWVFKEN